MFIALNYGNHSRLSARDYSFIYAICAVALALSAGHVVLAVYDFIDPNHFPTLALALYNGVYTLENALVFGIFLRVKVLKRHSSSRIARAFHMRRSRCNELVWALTVLFVFHTLFFSVLQCVQSALQLVYEYRGEIYSLLYLTSAAGAGETAVGGAARDALAFLLSIDFYMIHETLAPIAFFFSSQHFRTAWTATLAPCSSNQTRRPPLSHIHVPH